MLVAGTTLYIRVYACLCRKYPLYYYALLTHIIYMNIMHSTTVPRKSIKNLLSQSFSIGGVWLSSPPHIYAWPALGHTNRKPSVYTMEARRKFQTNCYRPKSLYIFLYTPYNIVLFWFLRMSNRYNYD